MAQSLELFCVNTCIIKRDEHLITYRSGGKMSPIDYILVRKEERERKRVTHCKVKPVPGKACVKKLRTVVRNIKWKEIKELGKKRTGGI